MRFLEEDSSLALRKRFGCMPLANVCVSVFPPHVERDIDMIKDMIQHNEPSIKEVAEVALLLPHRLFPRHTFPVTPLVEVHLQRHEMFNAV